LNQVIFGFFLYICAVELIPAQTQLPPDNLHGRCELWGQVITPGLIETDGMEIELTGKSPVPRQRTRVVNTGFDFDSVPAGVYLFRVFDRSGQLLLQRTESLTGSDDHVLLRLPYSVSEPSLSNTVAFAELSHKIPRNALDAFRLGLKAVRSGELQTSIDYFQKAATIDPRFVEAEINLAAQYGTIGRFEEALEHAQRAFDIRPGDPETGHALGTLLIFTKQYARAEALARFMLAREQAVAEMNAVLAVSLIGQGRSFDEAFAHLEHASEKYPLARLQAANVLVEIGLPTVAVAQVKTYLRSCTHECERAALARWIGKMERLKSALADAH